MIPWTNDCTVEKEYVETEGATEVAWEKYQAFLASAASHVAKKKSRGMSLTCPFCDVRKPEPVTSSRETVRYRPEKGWTLAASSIPGPLVYRSFEAPWMNEQKPSEKEKKNLFGDFIREGIIEQRISIYGNGTGLRK